MKILCQHAKTTNISFLVGVAFVSLLFSATTTYANPQKLSLSKAWGVVNRNKSKITSQLSSSSPTTIDEVTVESTSSVTTTTTTTTTSNVLPRDDNLQKQQDRQRPLKIIIMGGPASGKGTQCERIAQEHNLIHLSTGDMLREAVKKCEDDIGGGHDDDDHHDVGRIAKEYMDAGKLVPDDIMIQIVMDRISQSDCVENGWLLDGFPRTEQQAHSMTTQMMTKLSEHPNNNNDDNHFAADIFLFLNVPDSILMDRVVGRRMDPVTGKIYHVQFSPPPIEDASIRERLVQRSDDTVEKMQSRLQQFHTNVDSVREYYQDILIEIDGSKSSDDVAENIRDVIQESIRNRRVGNTEDRDQEVEEESPACIETSALCSV